jgi:hypothetical protein
MSSMTAPGFWKYVGAPSPPPPPQPPSGALIVFSFDFNFIEQTSNDTMPVGTYYQTNPGTNSQPVVFTGNTLVNSEAYAGVDAGQPTGQGGFLGPDFYDFSTAPVGGYYTEIIFDTPHKYVKGNFTLTFKWEMEVRIITTHRNVLWASFDMTSPDFVTNSWQEPSTQLFPITFIPPLAADEYITAVRLERGNGQTALTNRFFVDNVSFRFGT